MRIAGAVVTVLISATLLALVSRASANSLATVSVAVTTASVRESVHTRSDVLLLWNRNQRSRPIGNGVKSCIKSGSGGVRGGGLMTCVLSLDLPLGKVVASGTVHNVDRYTLVVTGGTGAYVNARGPLFVRRVAGGVRRLTFDAG